MKPWLLSGLLAGLALSFSCGGGGGAAPAPPDKHLFYSDVNAPTNWRLVRNGASSDSKLILDLMAPTGVSGRGFTVILSTGDPGLLWLPVDGEALVKNQAYSGILVQRASVSGGDLRVLLSQKPGTPVVYGNTPVLSVALKASAQARTGSLQLAARQVCHLGTSSAPETVSLTLGQIQVE